MNRNSKLFCQESFNLFFIFLVIEEHFCDFCNHNKKNLVSFYLFNNRLIFQIRLHGWFLKLWNNCFPELFWIRRRIRNLNWRSTLRRGRSWIRRNFWKFFFQIFILSPHYSEQLWVQVFLPQFLEHYFFE